MVCSARCHVPRHETYLWEHHAVGVTKSVYVYGSSCRTWRVEICSLFPSQDQHVVQRRYQMNTYYVYSVLWFQRRQRKIHQTVIQLSHCSWLSNTSTQRDTKVPVDHRTVEGRHLFAIKFHNASCHRYSFFPFFVNHN